MGMQAAQTTLMMGRALGWHLERVPLWEVAPQGTHSPGGRQEGVMESLSLGSTRGWATDPGIQGTSRGASPAFRK